MNTRTHITVRSPAKLILSGEHAVVHGWPALAVTVNRYTTVRIQKTLGSSIRCTLRNLHYAHTWTVTQLLDLRQQLLIRYQSFLDNRIGIASVLQKPEHLALFTIANLLTQHPFLQRCGGLSIEVISNIPICSGMGSSASLITALIQGFRHLFNLPISPEKHQTLGIESENLQHGHTSGLDILLTRQGGCIRYTAESIEQRPLPQFPMILIHTGTPRHSTGDCVSRTERFFTHSPIGSSFCRTTEALDTAITEHHMPSIQNAIQNNHRLLTTIGVTPWSVQNFIQTIENHGGAAKICGAGSYQEDHAGVVLMTSPQDLDLDKIMVPYPYELLKVAAVHHGTHTY